MLCYEKKLVWQQMTVPGSKCLLLAWNRLRAPAFLLSSFLFGVSFWGSVNHPVLFQHSSTADHVRGTKKTLNNSMSNFIAAGDWIHHAGKSQFRCWPKWNSTTWCQIWWAFLFVFALLFCWLFACLLEDLSLIFLAVIYTNIEHYL